MPKIIVSPTPKPGRFGTTLSKLGDINHDGYNDIAVGAPFDANGSVYIYLGSAKGLREVHSQKIKPPMDIMNLSPSSGGFMFGHGLSKGVDIDFNTYNDFAIGAPNAEMVYLYRAYPVVQVIASVSANREITTSQNSIEINACYGINTTSAKHENQELKLTLVVDPTVNRAKFTQTGSSTLEINVIANSIIKCDTHRVNINFDISSIFKPIEVKMNYEIINKIPTNSRSFCENCVAVDPADSTFASQKIIFSTGCQNEICVADLKVSSINLDTDFILGSSRVLTVEYEIENKGEPAFLPQINFTSSMGLEFNRVPPNCNKVRSDVLVCTLFHGRHMNNGDKDKIKIDYDVSELKGNSLSLSAEVFSAGKEAYYFDNVIRDTIKLSKFSEIEISTNTEPEKINLEENSNTIDIINSFDIKNIGPSHIENLIMAFYVPVAYKLPDSIKNINIVKSHNISVTARFNDQNLKVIEQNNFMESSSLLDLNQGFQQVTFEGKDLLLEY